MSTLSYVPEQTAKISLRPSRQAIKRAALALALILGVAGAADFGYGYLTTGRYLESTDDAYVKADSTIVAPKVSGYIAEVLVGDNQPVKAGQLLARIDSRDFEAALAQAHADVDASGAAVAISTRRSPCSSPSSSRKAPMSPPPRPTLNSPRRSRPATTG